MANGGEKAFQQVLDGLSDERLTPDLPWLTPHTLGPIPAHSNDGR